MRTGRTRALASAVIAVLVAGASAGFGAGPASASRATTATVTMSVVDVSPNSPTVSRKPRPLTFTLQLVNHSADPVTVSTISAARSDPIGSQDALDNAIAHPKAPSSTGVSPLTASAKNIVVPGNGTAPASIKTNTDVLVHDGVCLCANLIYPFWFIATYSTGTATAQTFVPSFTKTPVKSRVSWVWPLLDRPHRLLQSKIFFDDALAKEITPGGRLGRLLDVLKSVAPDVPMTVVTDPDLIDELVQMASGYKVSTPNGLVTGTGAVAAESWLTELRGILSLNRDIKIEFTPFADPAVDSLSRAGMDWPIGLDSAAQDAVQAALGNRTPGTELAWPVGRGLGPTTLTNLVQQGVQTIIVSDSSLTNGGVQPVPNALAQTTQFPNARFAVTSAPIERLVDAALNPTANGLAVLPELVAQLAVRVEEDVAAKYTNSRYVLIAPPRELDVNPAIAARVIEATSNSTWSSPISIDQATASSTISNGDWGTLRATSRVPQLPHRLLHSLRRIDNEIPKVETMFHDQTVGQALFANYPTAIQRCESTSLISHPAVARAMAGRLQHVITTTQASVYIVKPTTGTYTLTSKNSPLPITVVNHLNTEVDVQISVDPVGGESGLTASAAPGGYTIKANSKVQVHVPTHVDRVGLIRVLVRIQTPGGLPLGKPIPLTVRSTALGTIGVIITVLAGILLVVAVAIRQVRRLRNRTPREPQEPMPVAATTASQP